ncbi:FkbM family methyltransferase [Streptomyces sp. NPDC005132]|uniref:FkbM family methyltransferase n=1 Tax=Streptomyces sp. NPDC005132 TaxID=3154294 RepID=UPI0033AB5C90
MPTLYRRMLGLLPRIGVQVLDLGSGAAVVYRRGRRTRVPVGRTADLIARGQGRYEVTAVGPEKKADMWVVARQSSAQGDAWGSVPFGESGGRLLVDETASAADERRFQIAAAEYLCTQHVTALLEKYRVNCVFDVGANAGQYGRRLRRLGYTGRIVSFEPTADAFEKLERAAEKDDDWQVFNVGLGREDSAQSIHVGWNTMNSLLPPSDYGKDRYLRFAKTRTEDIEIRRLDGMLEKALDGITDPRPYLKMDTQGYDLEVFAGAGERIADFVGMQSEVAALRLYEGSPRMREAIATYEEAGFEITGMYPVTREETTGRVVEFDCVMVRADAVPEATSA